MARETRFQKGSGAYRCQCCGKMTRETGDGESSVLLCCDCYWEGGVVNGIFDGEYVCTCGNDKEFDVDATHMEVTCKKCGNKTGKVDSRRVD